MNFWETEEAVAFFKEQRNKQGLTQADLVDIALSRPTIGKIESTKYHVGRAKVSLYCERLGFTLEELPKLLEKRENQNRDQHGMLAIELKGIETIIDSVGAKEGQRKLKSLHIPAISPHLATYHFLLAKCYLQKKNWTKTEKNLSIAIRIARETPELQETNMEAICFYELSRAYSRQNDLTNALRYIDKALLSFRSDRDREDMHHYLLFGKAFYLEILGKNGEADRILKNMWENLSEINSDVQLSMAELQANLCNKQNLFSDSIMYLNKAINLARKEKNYDRLYKLWTILGSTYKNMGQMDLAKACLKTASQVEFKTRNRILAGDNYIELGSLYMQEGDMKSAEELLQKAVILCNKENDAPRHAESLRKLGECLFAQKKKYEAIHCLEQALRIAKKHGYHKQIKKTLLKLALVWKDNTMKHQKYKDMYFDISVKLYRKEDN